MPNTSTRTRKKRRDSWGSISYDSKRKVGRIRYWAETPEGYRRLSKTVRGTRKDVERARSELMLSHSEDAPAPTVGMIWDKWAIPDMERRVEDGDLAPTTLTQYRRWWAKHVVPRWENVPCDQVRPLEVQQWLSGLPFSPARNAMPLLTKAMDYAVRYGYVTSNPMREQYLMPSKSTVRERDKGIWQLSELEGVWQKVYGTWMEPAFLIAAFGGCRVGEALGPMAGEIELLEVNGVPVALVPIKRQVEHHGSDVVDRLKNRQSERTVAIAGRAGERLAQIAASMPADWYLTNDGFGGHVPQERYMVNWRKLDAGHPFRNLRNSWQTWMRWELRVAPFFIESMMGHSVGGTTGRFYDRPQAEAFADVMAEAYAKRPYDADWKLGNGDD